MARRAVITGAGVITPLGHDLPSFRAGLLAGTPAVRRRFDLPSSSFALSGQEPGGVQFVDREFKPNSVSQYENQVLCGRVFRPLPRHLAAGSPGDD